MCIDQKIYVTSSCRKVLFFPEMWYQEQNDTGGQKALSGCNVSAWVSGYTHAHTHTCARACTHTHTHRGYVAISHDQFQGVQ